jgi:hypothetical protein
MWRVTEASLFASILFFYCPIIFPKEILKIEIEYFFQGFDRPISGFGFPCVAKTMEG